MKKPILIFMFALIHSFLFGQLSQINDTKHETFMGDQMFTHKSSVFCWSQDRGDGIFRSDNEGDSWVFAAKKLDSFSQETHSVFGAGNALFALIRDDSRPVPGGIYKSYNKGNTWINIMDSITGLPSHNWYNIRGGGYCNSTYFLLITSYDQYPDSSFVYYSNNGYNYNRGAYIGSLSWGFHDVPLSTSRFYFRWNEQGEDSLMYTLDGINIQGISFNGISKEFYNLRGEGSNNTLYSCSNGDPYRYNSATSSWTNIRGSNFDPTAYIDMIFPTEHFLFTYGMIIVSGNIDLKYYKSYDGGNNWTELTPSSGHIYIPLALHEVNPAKYIMGTQLGDLFVSSDTGNTWTMKKSGYLNSQGMHFAEYDDVLLLKTNTNGIIRSSDGGDTWNFSNTGLPQAVLNLVFSRSIFSNFDKFFVIAQKEPDGDSNFLYSSSDKGLTWSIMNNIPDFKQLRSVSNLKNKLIMQFWNDNNDPNSSSYFLYDGVSWELISKFFSVSNLEEIYGFCGNGNQLYMFTRNNTQQMGVKYSSTNGNSWIDLNTNMINNIVNIYEDDRSPKHPVCMNDPEHNRVIFANRRWQNDRVSDELYQIVGTQITKINTQGLPANVRINYLFKKNDYYYMATTMKVYASKDAINWYAGNDEFYWGANVAKMEMVGDDLFLGTNSNGLWKMSQGQADIGTDRDICKGDSLHIEAKGNLNNFSWCCGYGTNPILNLLPVSSFVLSASAKNIYGIRDTVTINVNVHPLPEVSFSVNDSSQCFMGNLFNFTNNTIYGQNYIWNFGDGTYSTNSNPNHTYLTYNNSYSVKLLAISDKGCKDSLEKTMVLIKSPEAKITLGGDSVFCDGGSVTLYANSGNFYYQWYKDNTPITGQTSPFLIVTESGKYQVEVIDKNNSCSSLSEGVQITVNVSDFGISFSGSPRFFTSPPFNVAFDNFTPNPSNYNWLWIFGDNNTSTDFQPFHSYTYNGKFTVTLIAEHKTTGCIDTATQVEYVSCSGGSANPCPIKPELFYSGLPLICDGDSIMVQADTGWNYTYIWTVNGTIMPDENKSYIYAKQKGQYHAFITNPDCSLMSYPFTLSFYNSAKPIIESSGTIRPCSNDSMELYVTTAYSQYLWSTGETGPEIWVKNSGDYQVTIIDGYGCRVKSSPFKVNASFLPPPEICLVTVDSTYQKNLIVWERPLSSHILGYNVYKETSTADVYQKIAYVPYDSLSVYLDLQSNPKVRANRYKITMIDTCNIESAPSKQHKTIHLTANLGTSGENNLIWSHYEGFPFTSYKIYRGTSPTNISLLDTVPSNLKSYSDLTPPTGLVFYMITVLKPDTCYPAILRAYNNSGPFSQSMSNLKDYQAGGANYLQILPETYTFDKKESSVVFMVYTNLDNWQAVSSESWLSINPSIATKEIEASVTENTTGADRNAKITVSGMGVSDIEVNIIQSGTSSIDEKNHLTQLLIYPNPFEGTTQINYDLSADVFVNIEIYNMLGKRICVLASENQTAGFHQYTFNTDKYGVSGGLYFVRFRIDNKTYTHKIVDVK